MEIRTLSVVTAPRSRAIFSIAGDGSERIFDLGFRTVTVQNRRSHHLALSIRFWRVNLRNGDVSPATLWGLSQSPGTHWLGFVRDLTVGSWPDPSRVWLAMGAERGCAQYRA